MTTQKRDIDAVTGVETTGHEWDGIKELNKPLPRWWVWTFYATILWAIGYWIAYPAWPTLAGYTRGMLGYSQRATVADEVKAALASTGAVPRQVGCRVARPDQGRRRPPTLRHGGRRGSLPDQLRALPRPRCPGLRRLSQPQRRRMAVGRQARGHPQDHQRRHPLGRRRIRAPRRCRATASTSCSTTRRSTTWPSMSSRSPASRPTRRRRAEARRSSSSSAFPATARTARACGSRARPTSPTASGSTAAARRAIIESIRTGRGGMMPAWAGRLDPVTLKALAVYVHSLGGGQ